MRTNVSIAWHRGDLRTHDHPALSAAVSEGPAVGLVIFDDNILNATSPRRAALFAAYVLALRESYRQRGGTLYVRTGKPATALQQFIDVITQHANVTNIHALRSFTPYGISRDHDLMQSLNVPIRWHDGLYVHSPGTIRTKTGGAFSVYAAYRKAWGAAGAPEPLASPQAIHSPALPHVDEGDIPHFTSDIAIPEAGEDAALRRLTHFLTTGISKYAMSRDRLDGSGSSRLSIDITIGALSARAAIDTATGRLGAGAAKWIDELAWRDFLADTLFHRPDMITQPFHPRWNAFPWNDSDADFTAWREGRTGIPVVDAAMRELEHTGWISNRARMVAAQFLTKHMRIHWSKGARIFHELLLDGDTASNTGNWQWAAGLGIDNAPYFRVFNPVTQGEQHDPDGTWLRRWVPECDGNPAVMNNAIVDLKSARREYLACASELPRA